MDSHIQMPKFVLKQFADEKGMFYKYDVAMGYISKGTPAATNTQKDYYSQQIEEELSKAIETPFSQKIIEKLKKDPDSSFGKEEIEIMYKYAYALIARDPEMIKGIKKKSRLYKYFDEQTQHDLAIMYGKPIVELATRLKKDFTPTILLNKTERPFILPTCGMYSISRKDTGEKFIILPFDKYKAIYLIDNRFIDKFSRYGGITRASLDNVELVDHLNERAFQTQIKKKSGFVVAQSRELLEQLKCKFVQ